MADDVMRFLLPNPTRIYNVNYLPQKGSRRNANRIRLSASELNPVSYPKREGYVCEKIYAEPVRGLAYEY
jgi:hypothetical protein